MQGTSPLRIEWNECKQHHLERRPVHRNVATWQTSEVVAVGRQKIAILIRMQFLNDIIKSRHGFKTTQKVHKFSFYQKFMKFLRSFKAMS